MCVTPGHGIVVEERVQPSPAALLAGVRSPGDVRGDAGRSSGRGCAPPSGPASVDPLNPYPHPQTLIGPGTGNGGRSTAALVLGLAGSPNTQVIDFQWVEPIDIDDANLGTGQDIDIATAVGTISSGVVVVGGHARTGRTDCLTHVRKSFLVGLAGDDGQEETISRVDSEDDAFFPEHVGDGAVMEYAFYVVLTALTIHGDFVYATGYAHLAWQSDVGTDGSTVLWIIKCDTAEDQFETVECQVIGREPPSEAEPVACPSVSVALEGSQARVRYHRVRL